MNKNEVTLISIENRFKKVANISEDISVYPMASHLSTQVETDKVKSKEFSEVFTPLWLVDQMIEQVSFGKDFI